MKKRIYFLSMLAAGLAFASCTDDIDNVTSGENVAAGETGFVKIAINLPTTSGQSTRADDGHKNDQFDDGLPAEYAVKDAYLLVFGGSSESDAVYSGSYNLNTKFNTDDNTNDNITSKSEVVQAIKKPDGENTYALVVLNNNGILGSDVILTPGTSKLADLQTQLNQSVSAFIKNSTGASFTMTNAPIATKSSSGSGSTTIEDVSTLVKLDLYETKDKANAGTANEIYVERVVAKVTVTSGVFTESNNYTATIDNDGSYKNDKVTLNAWYLNVTNKSTNFVRDVSDWQQWKTYPNSNSTVSENRFFGLASGPYRVYWAIDHNYDDNDGHESALKEHFYIYGQTETENTMGNEGSNVLGDGQQPAYCLENTFVTSHMNQKETTAVVFKATYVLRGESAAQTFYVLGLPQEAGETYKKEGLAGAVNNKLSGSGLTVELKAGIDNLDAGYYDDEADMKLLFKTATADLTDPEAKQVFEALNCVRVYKNGVSYYGVRIQHFGDYYTPLVNGTGVADASAYDPKEHLGCYGVVRNNWYEINIADITGPGRPTPPDPTDPEDPDEEDPDDPIENMWIKCNINILSWAKRTQDVNL